MAGRTLLALAAFVFSGARSHGGEGAAAGDDPVRAAVVRALPLLQKGAVGHRENRSCFACHNQGLPVFAMATARARGFKIDEEEMDRQLAFIAAFLGRNRDNYLKGKGQGGQVDTAGHALWTLEAGGWLPDETTAAVAEYLLLFNKDQDFWRTGSNRPPSEASPFTTTYLALRGLDAYGTPGHADRIEAKRARVRRWLVKTPARDNEDRVFRLLALKRAGAEAGSIQDAARDLVDAQAPSGGWAQIPSLKPDAYATGTALVALHEAGMLAPTDAAYVRGVKFLRSTQLKDGSWHVRSRSKPFQLYFETGFPHGKDQFISSAASGWAAAALALACPTAETRRVERSPAR